MNPALLSIYPKFLLDEKTGNEKTPKFQIIDDTEYPDTVTLTNVVGVILLAKLDGTTFYQSTSGFNVPDNTLDPAVFAKKPLITTPSKEVLFGEYFFSYKCRIYNEVIEDNQPIETLVSSTVSKIVAVGAVEGQVAGINQLITDVSDSNLGIEMLNSSGVFVASARPSSAAWVGGKLEINFSPSLTIAAYASITQYRIITYYDKNVEVGYCEQDWPEAELQVQGDCLKATIGVSDRTQYLASDTLVSRIINFNYPVNANGTPVEAATSTTSSAMTVGPNVWSGRYTIVLTSVITRTQTDLLVLQRNLVKYNYFLMECASGLCCMKQCIQSIFEQYKAATSDLININLPNLRDQVVTILGYLGLYNISLNCGDSEGAEYNLNLLQNFLKEQGCTCDCEDNSTDEPTIIYPLFSEPQPNYIPISYIEEDDITIDSNSKVPSNKAVINYVTAAIEAAIAAL